MDSQPPTILLTAISLAGSPTVPVSPPPMKPHACVGVQMRHLAESDIISPIHLSTSILRLQKQASCPLPLSVVMVCTERQALARHWSSGVWREAGSEVGDDGLEGKTRVEILPWCVFSASAPATHPFTHSPIYIYFQAGPLESFPSWLELFCHKMGPRDKQGPSPHATTQLPCCKCRFPLLKSLP